VKKSLLFLFSLLLVLTISVNPSFAEKNDFRLTSNVTEFVNFIENDGKIAFINQEDADLSSLRKEIPIGLVVEDTETSALSKRNKEEKYAYFGAFKDNEDEIVPVYNFR